MTSFHVKAIALALFCASLTGCLPPPPPRTTTPPTQAELEAQAARRAERRARWRRALAAVAEDDQRKAKPYKLECRNVYDTTHCEDGDGRRYRCRTVYGSTTCEEEPY